MSNKKLIHFFILLIALIGCKSTNNVASEKAMYKSIYINHFKLTYFRQFLIKGYNNSGAIQDIIKIDHSGFTEPILTGDDNKLIDSLTTVDNDKMKIDSTEGDQRAEGSQGKRPFDFILERFNSKWIDSIAHKQYKRNRRIIKMLYN